MFLFFMDATEGLFMLRGVIIFQSGRDELKPVHKALWENFGRESFLGRPSSLNLQISAAAMYSYVRY